MTRYDGFAELERRGWTDDGISGGYVERFAAASDQAIPAIVAEIAGGARAGTPVLDLCCGQGNVAEALAAAGFAVTGVDFSPQMLAHARARAPSVEFIEADAQDLPFEAAQFGAVTCSFGLMHVPD